MGVVFQARHIFLKTPHAIKVILPDLVGNDPMLVTRFRQEALAAAAIRHRNIIAVTDFGVVRGTMPFLVMEFVSGKSLHDLLVEEGALPPARALEIIAAVGSGVAAAHRQGIVHRDLKPLNIMLQDGLPVEEAVKVLDFGLAKIKSGELLGSFVQAKTSGLMGSPYYMAPEQWGDEEPDARADIYSLGVILYQMLSGDVPFKGTSIPSIMKKHLTELPPSFASLGVQVPSQIETVVLHALEKEAANRPPSVEAFINELRDAVNAVSASLSRTSLHTISAPPPPGESSQQTSQAAMEAQRLRERAEALEEQARVEEEARQRAAEEEQRKAEAEAARLRAEEEARQRAEEEARQSAAEEERLRVAEAARLKEEEAVRQRAEAEARQRAEEEARRKAEEERLRLEAEAKRKAEEEAARKHAEEEARRLEEEKHLRLEAEASRRAEEERQRAEAQRVEREKREREEQAALVSPTETTVDSNLSALNLDSTQGQRQGVTTGELSADSLPGIERPVPVQQQPPPPYQPAQRQAPSAFSRPMPGVAAAPPRRSGVSTMLIAAIVGLLLVGGGIAAWYFLRARPDTETRNREGTPTPTATATASPGETQTPTPTPTATPFRPEPVTIPGGTFQMGRDGGAASEGPAHTVTVRSFIIDKTEVTNAEYAEFVRATGHEPPSNWPGKEPAEGMAMLPVVDVSYQDAVAFAEWRSKRDGATYRLPTEEEWEYAARGGDQNNLYPWGNKWVAGRAGLKDSGATGPEPVGSYPADKTRWGVLDMTGNVYEWTSSRASIYPGNKDYMVDPAHKDWVVVRGGAYTTDYKEKSPTTYRDWFPATTKKPVIGFRLVRVTSSAGAPNTQRNGSSNLPSVGPLLNKDKAGKKD